jgi:hypothetical protein
LSRSAGTEAEASTSFPDLDRDDDTKTIKGNLGTSPKSDLTAAAVQQSVFSPNYVEARHGILDHAVGMSLPTA